MNLSESPLPSHGLLITPVKENGIVASTPTSMIRVDYQKKVPAIATPILWQTTTTQHHRNPTTTTTTTPASPVSSVQEEFYSYLGISSKSSGDSDAEPSTTTPSKSPLVDDFDLSKRRSLRVRVVNKLKEHQAKLLKMAESSTGEDTPGGGEEEESSKEAMDEGEEHDHHQSASRSSRLGSQCSSIGPGGDCVQVTPNSASSTTILARRCYFSKSVDRSPSQSPCTVKLFPQPFVALSPIFLSPGGQHPQSTITTTSAQDYHRNNNHNPDNFSDFEDEIKKHVQLSSSNPSPTTTTTFPTPVTTPSVVSDSPVVPESTNIHLNNNNGNQKSSTNKKTKQKNRKLLTKRILIRRTEFTAAPRKRFNSISSKWPKSALMDSTSSGVNLNNRRKLKIPQRVPEVPSCTVNLKKFKLNNNNIDVDKNPSPTLSIPNASESTPPLIAPEFTIMQKADDFPPYTVLDTDKTKLPNPLGAILGTHYCERDRVLLVVTEQKVTFFKHHTNVAMFQKVVPQNHPSKPSRTVWSQIDQVDRLNRDKLVEELMFEKRIMRATISVGEGSATTTKMVYVELRAQPLLKDREYRTGEMSATYVNLYYLSQPDEAESQTIEVNSVALDTIVALPQDISYTILPMDNALIMCWTERHVAKRRLGICKYKLSEDLSTLSGVEEFQSIDGELNGIRWNGPNYVIGTGNQQISIWDNNTGVLLSNIVLTDFELGDTIFAQVLNVDKHEKHLLLLQYWQNYLNVVHVNLLDFAYRVLKSRELNCTKQAVQSVVRVEAGDSANVIVGFVARGDRMEKGAGLAHEMLEIFDALTNRLVVMQRQDSGEGGCSSRLFLNERYLVKLGDKLEPDTISIQAVNEFLFNLI